MRTLVLLVLSFAATGCGPRTMEARMRDAEKSADRAGTALDEAQRAIDALEPGDLEDALEDAKRALDDPDISLYPEAGMHQDRYRELAAKLPEVKKQREQRDLERRLNAARDKVVPRVHALLEAVDALTPTTATADQLQQVEKLAKAVNEAVDDDKDLFEKDKDFALWANGQKAKTDRALEVVAKAKKALAFREGVLAALQAGASSQTAARGKKPDERLTLLTEAQAKLTSCMKDAAAVAKDPSLAALAFPMSRGKPQTPAQVEKTCQKALKAVDKQRLAVEKQLAKKPKGRRH